MRINFKKGYYYIGDVNIFRQPHGLGKEYRPDGTVVYEGNWSFGKYHGKGIYYYASGTRYEGEWVRGEKHGQGIEYNHKGGKQVGIWVKGDMQGKGILYYADGSVCYEGDFQRDMPNGNGVFYYENGDRYEGGVYVYQRHGYGIYYFKSGDKYEGGWSSNQKHGDGIQYSADGIVYKGSWHKDKFCGIVTVYYPLGAIYEREYDDKGNLIREERIDDISQSQYVFISYSSKNKDYAEGMRQLLNTEHIRTWMAPYDIPAGSKYAYVINDAIENCACVLLVLTEQSQSSEWVAKEIERAVKCKKTIISMHLDESQLNGEFGFYLGNQQIVPVKSVNKDDESIQKVLHAIKFFPQ